MYTSGLSLGNLRGGQSAQVLGLSPAAGDAMRRRFQDLGLIPGTRVECLGRSPLGDPCAYLIRGAVIALRRADAEHIGISGVTDAVTEEHPVRERVADYGAL